MMNAETILEALKKHDATYYTAESLAVANAELDSIAAYRDSDKAIALTGSHHQLADIHEKAMRSHQTARHSHSMLPPKTEGKPAIREHLDCETFHGREMQKAIEAVERNSCVTFVSRVNHNRPAAHMKI
jgi:hypothetical protein